MDHSFERVELRSNDVEILGVGCVISPEHCVGDVVGELDETGSPGIYEQGCLRDG